MIVHDGQIGRLAQITDHHESDVSVHANQIGNQARAPSSITEWRESTITKCRGGGTYDSAYRHGLYKDDHLVSVEGSMPWIPQYVDHMLKVQDFCCAICEQRFVWPIRVKGRMSLVRDHKGMVERGLLHRRCNSWIDAIHNDVMHGHELIAFDPKFEWFRAKARTFETNEGLHRIATETFRFLRAAWASVVNDAE